MTPLRFQELDPLHPESENKVYTVHFPSESVQGADITSATWTCTTSGAVTIESSAIANPGEDEHTAVEVQWDETYSGPLLSVTVSNGTAVEGDVVYLRVSFETDLTEGPVHRDFKLLVTARGM